MKKLSFLVLTVILLSGCATTSGRVAAATEAVLNRASFDLNCPKDQITVHPMGDIGVRGCGKKATYKAYRCIVGLTGYDSCEVLLNSPITEDN